MNIIKTEKEFKEAIFLKKLEEQEKEVERFFNSLKNKNPTFTDYHKNIEKLLTQA